MEHADTPLPAALTAPDAPVRLAVDGGIAVVTLNRPDAHNVLDVGMSRAVIAAVEATAAAVRSGSVRAVLIRGTGRSFCAGGDIQGFAGSADARAALLHEMIPPLSAAVHALATLPVPVVAALNGAVGGGGLGLAFCADITIAAESMALRGGYTAIGLTPDVGASWFVTRAIGAARAKRVFFANEKITAAQCLAWGLVSEVVPDARLDTRALALVRSLAAGATHALACTKQLVDGAGQRTLAEHLALEARSMVAAGRHAESAEGVAAFLEKRAPRFG